jgi:NADPH2:quinone reductase
MKAVLCKAYGPPESLAFEEVPAPSLGRSGVRISVRACGVNFPDLLMIQGLYQFKPPFPFSPGAEVSGVVLEVGEDVEGIAQGDRVIGMTGWNGFVEEAVVDAAKCLKMPDAMDFETAAGLPMTYGTSYHALVQRAKLRAGEVLLVHGATGGVGTAAVEIGKLLGARVIATAGSDEKLAVLREKYAIEHVINYRTENFKDRVKELTDGKGADVIYDPVGGEVFEPSLRCIAWDGRLLVVGFASGKIPELRANLVLLKNCSVIGVFWGAWSLREPEVNAANFRELMRLYTEGKLKPIVSCTYPLEQAAGALNDLAARKVVGKAVLTTGRS